MNLELRHLRVVCAIADHGSLTKAASALGLAQPALTAQLQRIEETLGGTLFDRGRHGARPTVLGELVLERARVVLPAVHGLRDEAVRLANSSPMRYRIGTVNGPLLGGLVSRLTAEHPDALITLHPALSAADLVTEVSEGGLDFALVGVCGDAPAPGPNLAWRTLAVDPMFVLLPDNHPLAESDGVALRQFPDSRWATTVRDPCFAECFSRVCTQAGFTPRPMYEVDLAGCVDLALGGDAVVLCQPTVRLVPGLSAVPVTGSPLRWRHLLGWHPASPAASYAARVAEHATAAYLDAVERSPRYRHWLTQHPGFGAAIHNATV